MACAAEKPSVISSPGLERTKQNKVEWKSSEVEKGVIAYIACVTHGLRTRNDDTPDFGGLKGDERGCLGCELGVVVRRLGV